MPGPCGVNRGSSVSSTLVKNGRGVYLRKGPAPCRASVRRMRGLTDREAASADGLSRRRTSATCRRARTPGRAPPGGKLGSCAHWTGCTAKGGARSALEAVLIGIPTLRKECPRSQTVSFLWNISTMSCTDATSRYPLMPLGYFWRLPVGGARRSGPSRIKAFSMQVKGSCSANLYIWRKGRLPVAIRSLLGGPVRWRRKRKNLRTALNQVNGVRIIKLKGKRIDR